MQVKVFRVWVDNAETDQIEELINDFLLEIKDQKIDRVTQSEGATNGRQVVTVIIWYS